MSDQRWGRKDLISPAPSQTNKNYFDPNATWRDPGYPKLKPQKYTYGGYPVRKLGPQGVKHVHPLHQEHSLFVPDELLHHVSPPQPHVEKERPILGAEPKRRFFPPISTETNEDSSRFQHVREYTSEDVRKAREETRNPNRVGHSFEEHTEMVGLKMSTDVDSITSKVHSWYFGVKESKHSSAHHSGRKAKGGDTEPVPKSTGEAHRLVVTGEPHSSYIDEKGQKIPSTPPRI